MTRPAFSDADMAITVAAEANTVSEMSFIVMFVCSVIKMISGWNV